MNKVVLMVAVTLFEIFAFFIAVTHHLPLWLLNLLMAPALLMYCKIAGQNRPSVWATLVFVACISAFFEIGIRIVPSDYLSAYCMLGILVPFGPIGRWLKRLFAGKRLESKSVPLD
jgi:hypothetical protein